MPNITEQYCVQLMSFPEANTLLSPLAPITSVTADNPSGSGTCSYKTSSGDTPLTIHFVSTKGASSISESDIVSTVSGITGSTNVQVNSYTPVSGIASQGAYLAATVNQNGSSFTMSLFFALEGSFFYECFTYTGFTVNSPATQAQLQQCAKQVDSRL